MERGRWVDPGKIVPGLMETDFDFIVVGSGATGAMAAQTLVESGARVAVLDVGEKDEVYAPLIPDQDFDTLRRQDPNQHRYLLGDDFEGVPWKDSRVGSQLTPPRQFLTRNSERFLPFDSSTLIPMESLARGGLGGGWGLGCYLYSSAELEAAGLDETRILDAYDVIAARIGVSATRDDASPYCLRDLRNFQPSISLEENSAAVYRAYQRKREVINSRRIFVGRPPQAVLSMSVPGRKATQYKDMEYWSDRDKSEYRSWMTMDELQKAPNFSYHDRCLVVRFSEEPAGVAVHVLRTDSRETRVFRARKLVLSPGPLGTARIVSRSLGGEQTMPFICNPYCYIPCVQWRRLGSEPQRLRSGLGQLVMFLDEKGDNFDVGMAALFSYRSLLLFKLMKETPLNFADARIIMQYLQSAFIIAGINHPERPSASKFIRIRPASESPTGDALSGQYSLSDAERTANALRERQFKWALRALGCQPLRTLQVPHGGSIHYAGTLPFDSSGKPFTLDRRGRLSGTRAVYVADGSGFRYLPAKGITFTLMANAHCVARESLKNE
jgi:hypothetical protein